MQVQVQGEVFKCPVLPVNQSVLSLIIYNINKTKEKQQILTLEKLQPDKSLVLKMTDNQNSCFIIFCRCSGVEIQCLTACLSSRYKVI